MKPFVKVRWNDATDDDRTWLKESEAVAFGATALTVISWGWLLSRTKQYVTMAADYIPETNTYGRVTKIPAGMLVSLEEFEQE